MLTRHGSGLEYWLTATGLAQLVWFGRRIRALFAAFSLRWTQTGSQLPTHWLFHPLGTVERASLRCEA